VFCSVGGQLSRQPLGRKPLFAAIGQNPVGFFFGKLALPRTPDPIDPRGSVLTLTDPRTVAGRGYDLGGCVRGGCWSLSVLLNYRDDWKRCSKRTEAIKRVDSTTAKHTRRYYIRCIV